ncbi:atp-dependent rna helicase dbp9 [Moniliophthora roreri]|nr:atp-dependent rna helicase dbp9 [Moniliophthora roreri]
MSGSKTSCILYTNWGDKTAVTMEGQDSNNFNEHEFREANNVLLLREQPSWLYTNSNSASPH